MSLTTQQVRDMEEYINLYISSRTPAEQDAILHKVRDLYGAQAAVSLMNNYRVNRRYYTPQEEATQEHNG